MIPKVIIIFSVTLASLSLTGEASKLRQTSGNDPDHAQAEKKRAALRDYFNSRQKDMNVLATTFTESGQILDWIDPTSQVPDGLLAMPQPPPPPPSLLLEEGNVDYERESKSLFELPNQEHARGPRGLVPVLRRNIADVLKDDSLPDTVQDFLSKYGKKDVHGFMDSPNKSDDQGQQGKRKLAHEFAYAEAGQRVASSGSVGTMSVWNPFVHKVGEHSISEVALAGGSPLTPLQTVETGWRESELSYGDKVPHFFIWFTTDGHQTQADYIGGYDLDVKGFVQVSETVFPGAVLTEISSYNGEQHTMDIRIQLYQGNWWITVNNENVGYYPAHLFDPSGISGGAERVHWYGEVVDWDDGEVTCTDMGSGRHANEGFRKAAFMRNLRIYDLATSQLKRFDPDWTSITDSDRYSIDPYFNSTTEWGSHFYYGGPGVDCLEGQCMDADRCDGIFLVAYPDPRSGVMMHKIRRFLFNRCSERCVWERFVPLWEHLKWEC
jgi:hypothetical protein